MSSPPLAASSLLDVFKTAEKPRSGWLIGLEAERFGFDKADQPLRYGHPNGVDTLLSWLCENAGWAPYRETEAGPVVAVQRGNSSITLEPGGQVELSGQPHPDLHALVGEYRDHLRELGRAHAALGIWFAHVGFHPSARLEEFSWVPKRRYPIMRNYLPQHGSRALDMMLRTSTVQVNLDYADEADAMFKLTTLLKLTPLLQAMTLNSPFIEGAISPRKSERLDVWLNMDAKRSGLIGQLWREPQVRYSHYVDWALDAGMFLFVRDGNIFENTGQTFREFMTHGFAGQTATEADWRLHLGTLFPEVRLKNTLEVRCCDSLPPPLTYAIPALLTGLTYDSGALEKARALVDRLSLEGALALQREVAVAGLQARFDGRPLVAWCQQLLEFSAEGLRRRARMDAAGRDESVYLEPLVSLVASGQTPADAMLKEFGSSEGSPAALLRRQWQTVLDQLG